MYARDSWHTTSNDLVLLPSPVLCCLEDSLFLFLFELLWLLPCGACVLCCLLLLLLLGAFLLLLLLVVPLWLLLLSVCLPR